MHRRSDSKVVDRRRLLTIAMAIAAAAAANLFPAAAPAAETDAIRSFRINVPEADLLDLRRRLTATRWPDRGNRRGSIPGRAARKTPGARALLGHGLRLAENRSETECACRSS